MNEANYASLEASKRLDEAGIRMETEKSWIMSSTGWELADNIKYYGFWKDAKKYPAPSMAEVWRKLPKKIQSRGLWRELCFSMTLTVTDGLYEIIGLGDANPTDALIDLLIWVKEKRGLSGEVWGCRDLNRGQKMKADTR